MKHSLLPSLLFAALFSTGCGAPQSEDPASSPTAASQKQEAGGQHPPDQVVGANFAAQVVSGPKANDYKVALQWNSPAGYSGGFQIKRTEPNGTVAKFAVTGSQSSFVDETIPTRGVSYTYLVTPMAGEAGTPLGHATLYVPIDLEISNQQGADAVSLESLGFDPKVKGPRNLNRYDRIFMKERTTLRVGFEDLTLNANELVAEGQHGVTIENLQEGAAATPGSPGHPGGALFVHVKTAHGRFTIISRGERGGQGNPGASGPQGPQGASGSNAVWKGGDYERGLINTCTYPATPGQPGGQGGDGGVGGDGFPGGDTAFLHFVVDQAANDLNLDAKAIPGPGGRGGDGGRAGPGGAGGNPGSNDIGWTRNVIYQPVEYSSGVFCSQGRDPFPRPTPFAPPQFDPNTLTFYPAPPRGPSGPAGVAGARGAGGDSGNKAQVCVEVGGKKTGC